LALWTQGQGWENFKPLTAEDGEREMIVADSIIRRKEIPGLFSEFFRAAMAYHARYKAFGMPFAGGWAEQPERLLRVLEVVDHGIAEFRPKG